MLEWRENSMSLEELLEILDIEEAEDFQFFENYADLMEYDGEIRYDDLYALIKRLDMVNLGEFIETYMDEILESIPSDYGIEVYTFLTSVKMLLLGLAESIAAAEEEEEREELSVFVEEIFKFRNWLTRESEVHLTRRKDKKVLIVTLLEAITAYRVEKLSDEEYIYDFSECIPYEIDEYMVSVASALSDMDDEDEEEEGYLDQEEEYEE
jgi:phage terminase Nu1 subunit (DNA packaging protein)